MTAARTTARLGFSLIELSIVVLILALVAASLSFRWAGLLEPTRLDHAVTSAIRFDGHTRDLAISDRCRYQILVGEKSTSLISASQSEPPTIRRLDFAKGVTIDSLAIDAGIQRNAERGTIVDITRAGTSFNYSVEISSSAGTVRVNFSGGTGECTVEEVTGK